MSLPATAGDKAAILLQERVKTGHEFGGRFKTRLLEPSFSCESRDK